MAAWIQTGRLPEPPCCTDYPLSRAEWTRIIAKMKAADPPASILARLEELEESLRSPEGSAAVDRLEAEWREKQEKHWDSRVEPYLKALEEQGVDIPHLLRLISGGTTRQPVKLHLLFRKLSFLTHVHTTGKDYRPRLQRLWKSYRSTLHLLSDEALRPETRECLRKDLEDIFRCIRLEADDAAWRRLFPEEGITVLPTKDLSRQAFWTQPTVALVDYLAPILGSNQKAYVATARLFHLRFDYPDKPALIKRRFLNARRKPTRRA